MLQELRTNTLETNGKTEVLGRDRSYKKDRTVEIVNVFCFKALSLYQFITAALGN